MTSPLRPVFLNLTRIRMPVGALACIGYRISGIALAAGVSMGAYGSPVQAGCFGAVTAPC